MKIARRYEIMKPVFVKVDKLEQQGDLLVLHLPAGGIQLEHNDELLLMNESLKITIDGDGEFHGILNSVKFLLYDDQSIEAKPWVLKRTLGEIVSYEGFEDMIDSEIKNIQEELK